ncbi:MAG: SMR family transporter [bacterium]|nr:SMR family transporter [bacterium]
MNPYIFLVTALTLNAAANILLKLKPFVLSEWLSIRSIADTLPQYPFILAILVYALSVFFYSAALAKINLSVSYPFALGGAFIIVTIASIFIFKEHVNVWQATGLLLILAGIALVVSMKS